MAHKAGHKMNMGSKEKNTPGTFSEKDTKTIGKSTVGKMASKGADARIATANIGGLKDPKGVVLTGSKDKINNKVNVPTAAEKRAKARANFLEKKKIIAAKIAERKNEKANMRQVNKDKISNLKKQAQRKREGKDYQKPDGTVVRRRVKIVKK